MPSLPNSSATILLVEDDAGISAILSDVLEDAGFTIVSAASGQRMDAALETEQIDLVLLDIMLPDEDGLSICRRLRSISTIPIIMLTALKEDIDRIIGLEIGADDYITKPFNPRELIARIRALLRRSNIRQPVASSENAPRRFAGWIIHPTARQLHNSEGAMVTLTSAEFDLLAALCLNPRRILSREQLLELTHGGLAGPIERSIDVHISRIRQKIELDPAAPQLIKTVRLAGYIFTPLVELI
ncbi:two-component system OmpR family response regulator [Beijerinckia sp. GAS462]|nr:two-component system OmpR family response regulator [Beijerinckia sp. GAS462]SEB56641.1 two-component system, OmpR family, response regulator [Beijerinckia sp. 28-YEA-48]